MLVSSDPVISLLSSDPKGQPWAGKEGSRHHGQVADQRKKHLLCHSLLLGSHVRFLLSAHTLVRVCAGPEGPSHLCSPPGLWPQAPGPHLQPIRQKGLKEGTQFTHILEGYAAM